MPKLNQIDLKTAIAKIFIADLDADDMVLVDAVVNFKCWCVIPKAWSELIPLVDRLIEIAKLEPRSCYEVHGVY